MKLSEIWIYPIKSLGGISLNQTEIDQFGLRFDRRWMLIDSSLNFISQRTHPVLNQFKVSLFNNIMCIEFNDSKLEISLNSSFYTTKTIETKVWEDMVKAIIVSDKANKWFSKHLQVNCQLVFFPDSSKRLVDPKYASNNEVTSFTDGFPILLLSEDSLIDLNSRLDVPLEMKRFRPNLVYKSGVPYHEDSLKFFQINNAEFEVVKPCSRCIITTLDLETSKPGKEPLKTLATYRKDGNNVMFGQNILVKKAGEIRLGDKIKF